MTVVVQWLRRLVVVRETRVRFPPSVLEQKLKKFLEEEREDYLKLKRKNNLTKKGEGMLLMINVIFKEMRWKIKNL